MLYSCVSTLLAGVSLVLGSPIEKRDTPYVVDFAAPPGGDATILNYALTLEYLERKFYMEGLANYTHDQFVSAGFPDPFYSNLCEIYFDEKTHVTYLSGALTAAGAKPVSEAMYLFPSTDVKSFVSLASVLEGVGVSAYLGAAQAIANKAYLTAAGSILTVESRHSSYIRASLKESPFPKPFDTPLDFNQVFSLAAQFITGFAPGDAPISPPFKAFPPLMVQDSQYPFYNGRSSVTFSGAMKNAVAANLITPDTPVYAVFFSGLDTYYDQVRSTWGNSGDFKTECIPGGAIGQVYVVLSTADGNNTKVSDANTISGVGLLEVM